jgi:hypothetical protein
MEKKRKIKDEEEDEEEEEEYDEILTIADISKMNEADAKVWLNVLKDIEIDRRFSCLPKKINKSDLCKQSDSTLKDLKRLLKKQYDLHVHFDVIHGYTERCIAIRHCSESNSKLHKICAENSLDYEFRVNEREMKEMMNSWRKDGYSPDAVYDFTKKDPTQSTKDWILEKLK